MPFAFVSQVSFMTDAIANKGGVFSDAKPLDEDLQQVALAGLFVCVVPAAAL